MYPWTPRQKSWLRVNFAIPPAPQATAAPVQVLGAAWEMMLLGTDRDLGRKKRGVFLGWCKEEARLTPNGSLRSTPKECEISLGDQRWSQGSQCCFANIRWRVEILGLLLMRQLLCCVHYNSGSCRLVATCFKEKDTSLPQCLSLGSEMHHS